MGQTLARIFGINTHAVEIEYDDMFFFKMFDESVQVGQLDTAAGEVGALE